MVPGLMGRGFLPGGKRRESGRETPLRRLSDAWKICTGKLRLWASRPREKAQNPLRFRVSKRSLGGNSIILIHLMVLHL